MYLGDSISYMTVHSINLDVIGRYASGRCRPYRSRVVTSTSMELEQLPGLRARIRKAEQNGGPPWERSTA